MIFETHAHYDDEAFDSDRETLIGKLPEQGISPVVNVGASLDSCRRTLELVERYPFFPSLGFSTRFFQNYILIDVIQVSINAGFFCCLKI